MKKISKFILLTVFFSSIIVYAHLRPRPSTWSQPVLNSRLNNFYLVDNGIYRSKQPDQNSVEDLKSIGIKEILNLRNLHKDDNTLGKSNFILHRIEMDAGKVTKDQILETLKIIKNKKGPILVHCLHGSDRTGVVIAAYRIIFNNWSKPEALDEMINGGFGFHKKFYPNLVSLIDSINVIEFQRILEVKKQ